MLNAALDPSVWEELIPGRAGGTDELAVADDLEPSRGIIWWGFASLVFWLLLLPAVL